jgi:hypothetical protein
VLIKKKKKKKEKLDKIDFPICDLSFFIVIARTCPVFYIFLKDTEYKTEGSIKLNTHQKQQRKK